MNNQYTNHQYTPQNYAHQFSAQPQGLMYFINSLNELNSISANNTPFTAINLADNTCYIKTFQNGAPTFMSYTLTPITKEEKTEESELINIIKGLDSRLKILENLSKKGEKLDELI